MQARKIFLSLAVLIASLASPAGATELLSPSPASDRCCGGVGSDPTTGELSFTQQDGEFRWNVGCEYVLTGPSGSAPERTVGLVASADVTSTAQATAIITEVTCFLDLGRGTAASGAMAGSRVKAIGIQTHDVRTTVEVCVSASAQTTAGPRSTAMNCQPL
jgi:hypothetical protein